MQPKNKIKIHWESTNPNCKDVKKQFQPKFIVDFRCYFEWPNNLFHQLYDCVTANIPLVLATLQLPPAETYLIIPRSQQKYYYALLPAEWEKRFLPDNSCISGDNKLSVSYSIGADMTPDSRIATVNPEQFKWDIRKMRELVFKKYSIEPLPKHIVLIERIGSRSFDPSVKKILKVLFRSSLPNLPIVSYTGSESIVDTIRLFSSAQVIIGFHGAGMDINNIIYSSSNM